MRFSDARGSKVKWLGRIVIGIVALASIYVVGFTLLHRPTSKESTFEWLVGTIILLGVTWGSIAMLFWVAHYPKLGRTTSPWPLLLGPRPTDRDESRAWSWGRQFIYAFITVGVAMVTAYVLDVVRGR